MTQIEQVFPKAICWYSGLLFKIVIYCGYLPAQACQKEWSLVLKHS